MAHPHQLNEIPQKDNKVRILDLVLVPFGCLIRTPLILLALVGVVALFSWLAFTSFNWDVFGLAAPAYQDSELSLDFTSMKKPNGKTWEIHYEKNSNSTFTGLVRHVTPIQDFLFPLLTHDILVTRGDYADTDLVYTSVSNHHFTWRAKNSNPPSGRINLLHTVPADDEIYHQLLSIRNNNWVKITGREILSIDYLNPKGELTASWADTGCNTLLVTQIEILDSPVEK